MSGKALLKRLLLFPIQPWAFCAGIAAFRRVGLLPRRAIGVWPPKEILVVNLTANVGDSIMMMPTLDALHRMLPAASIDVIVEGPMCQALAQAPIIRRAFRFDSQKTKLPLFGHYLRVLSILRFARTQLAGQSYGLAVLPRWGTDPGLATYLAAASSAARICGHDPKEELGTENEFPGMTRLMTCVSTGGHGMPEAVREQLVLAACGLPLSLDPEAEEKAVVESVLQMSETVDAHDLLQRLGLEPDQRFALLSPGASHPARRWPAGEFAALGQRLSRKGLLVYTFGSTGDRALGDEIAALSNDTVRNLAGRTSILEGLALIRKAALLVTNDSGPAHMGGSLGTPTLVLSACPESSKEENVNSPLRVRPIGPRVIVLQPKTSAPGCNGRCEAPTAHCIQGIEIERVVEATQALLDSAINPAVYGSVEEPSLALQQPQSNRVCRT
ncbi:MAG TPA: glycosyltransferase family 9 protein [Bryocella sp.]|nr:glycosyltransferase family 9 protein [Bryocella sp.]